MYYAAMFWIGLLLWLLGAVYYGDYTPQNGMNRILDMFSLVFILIGAIGQLVVSAAKMVGRNIVIQNGDQTIKIITEMEKYHQARKAEDAVKEDAGKKIEKALDEAFFGGVMPVASMEVEFVAPKGMCFEEEAPEGMPEGFRGHWEEKHCEKHKTSECSPEDEKTMENEAFVSALAKSEKTDEKPKVKKSFAPKKAGDSCSPKKK